MKAFLLAAGKGTRLKPFTDHTPKCLIPIQGKPLLQIWIGLFETCGIQDVLINIHSHADQVLTWIEAYQPQTPVHMTPFLEPRLLGSAGTLWARQDFVYDEDAFVIAYADNLTNINLERMIAFHRRTRSSGGMFTMGLFRSPNPAACGIASLDSNNRILSFVEKPARPESDLANAGIYVSSFEVFHRFPPNAGDLGHDVLDLGYHVLPNLTGNMFGYLIPEYIRDIGSPEAYQAAQSEWV
ncbi:MAG: nucleotidyltransferase family protein [Desulfatirhabdiaceae bacterium]